MKRFIFGIIAFVICLMVVGAFWNMWLRKADDKELQKNIEFIRNIPTKMIP